MVSEQPNQNERWELLATDLFGYAELLMTAEHTSLNPKKLAEDQAKIIQEVRKISREYSLEDANKIVKHWSDICLVAKENDDVKEVELNFEIASQLRDLLVNAFPDVDPIDPNVSGFLLNKKFLK